MYLKNNVPLFAIMVMFSIFMLGLKPITREIIFRPPNTDIVPD